MISFFLFILGTIIGSFLNVVAMRWDFPHEDGAFSNFGNRSKCPECRKTLRWFELVPIISFLAQSGKCRNCGQKISYQYLIVEVLTGLVFVTLYSVLGLSSHFLIVASVFCIYIVIAIYDLKHKIIPDELVYVSIALAFFASCFLLSTPFSTLDWLAGPILFAFFGSIWLLSRGRAMGFGDAKLGLSIGLLLGAAQGFSAIILAFWIGASVSLLYIFLIRMGLPARLAESMAKRAGRQGFLKDGKKLTIKSEIPFAPFLLAGAWISLVFHLNLFHVLSF